MAWLLAGCVLVGACSTAKTAVRTQAEPEDPVEVAVEPPAKQTPSAATVERPVLDELDRGPICVAAVFHCNCSTTCTEAASMRELMSRLDCAVDCGEDPSPPRCGFVEGQCRSL